MMGTPATRVSRCPHRPSAFRELIPAVPLLAPLLILTWGTLLTLPVSLVYRQVWMVELGPCV